MLDALVGTLRDALAGKLEAGDGGPPPLLPPELAIKVAKSGTLETLHYLAGEVRAAGAHFAGLMGRGAPS